jgi:endonuclease/exonuclease/phosphatase family metal-dependent hydrolase
MVIQAIVLFVYFSATGLPLLIVLVYALIAAIGLSAAWHRPANEQRSTQIASASLATVAAMLLLTTLVATRRTDDPEAIAALPAEFTVMTYNIQSGFSRDNHWDLEETARVIEAAKPDVVFLQEVGRGWPILSGVDQASWLSRRLDMQLVWGPASQDELWGNAILTRAPILATEVIKYDTTENLKRGAVRAIVESASGPVTLIATHLDNPGDAASARQAQVAQLLTFWNNASPAVIGGDFNADPDSAAITAIVSAGMIDSGASLGPAATTSENNHRIDYLLVTPDLAVTGAEIPDTWASDHRPFVVRLRSSP